MEKITRKAQQTYSIKDLENITGTKAHTIRIWEERYNLFTPERTSTNIRVYSGDDLRKLLKISILIKQGTRISKLAGLSPQELDEQVKNSLIVTDNETIINGLVVDMIGFDRIAFESRLDEVIVKLGFEDTIYQVIYPFFHKVGILWVTDAINPAQEHFVSNIIKQRFFSAIGNQDVILPSAKKFILFLPENEEHELGLLLAYYLIRKHGHIGIYLGQNVPLDDVIVTWNVTRADYLVTHLTSLMDPEEQLAYLRSLTARAPGAHILVSGQQVMTGPEVTIRNVRYLKSPSDLTKRLEAIPDGH